MTYAMSKAEADEACAMVLTLLTSIYVEGAAPVTTVRSRGGRPHIHTCSSCSARWDEGLSTGKSQPCSSSYPQGSPAKMSEPGTVAPAPALTIATCEEPMMPEHTASVRPVKRAC